MGGKQAIVFVVLPSICLDHNNGNCCILLQKKKETEA